MNAPLIAESDGVVAESFARLGQDVKGGTTLFVIQNTDPSYNYAPQLVKAFFGGTVSAIDVAKGDRVQKGSRLAQVADTSQMKIVAEVTMADLADLVLDLKGEIRFPAMNAPIAVRINGISPIVDPATGTAKCEIFPEAPAKQMLHAGMIGRLTFKVREHAGYEIDEQSIVYKGADPYVRVVVEGKIQFVPITIRQRRNGMAEIGEGPAANAAVVLRASGYVADGDMVIIKESEVAKK